MSRIVWKLLALAMVASLILACAPAAPTPAPTKAPATALVVAPTVAPKVAPAPTTAVVATPKPAAPTATPAPKIKRGGILRTSHVTDWGSGDIHIDVSIRPDQQAHHESLFELRMNEKTQRFELIPVLVDSHERADPKTIILKLRRDVKFHDGSNWTAEIAKWNLLRMRDHPKSSAKDHVGAIESVDIVDDYTLKLNLKTPSISALWRLTASYGSRPIMMSKEAVDKYGEQWLATHYVGTGPFELVEWRLNDRQIFKRFSQYWQKGFDGQPLPYFDGLEIRWIPDASVATIELRTGNLHFAIGVQPRDFPTIQANPDLVLQRWPWEESGNQISLNPKGGPFKDNLKLRHAAQYAIDRESMAKTLGLGAGKPFQYLIPPGQVGHSEALFRYDYDAEKAKQLIKEAGYSDGVDIRLLVVSRQPDLPQSEIIKSMFDKVGIRTKLDIMERLATMAKVAANDFEAYAHGYGWTVDAYITFTRFKGCKGYSNYTGWCHEQFEACLTEADQEPNDEKRGQILQRCVKIAQEDAFYVHMWNLDKYDAFNKNLRGWGPYHAVINFWPELWLDK